MAFKGKPSKPLSRTTSLQTQSKMRTGTGFSSRPKSVAEQRDAQEKALQKATLRALEKARSEAAAAEIDLTAWESEFLDDVGTRVKTYGRAFADPDKGAINSTLSLRQGLKLKEIRKKARKGKPDNATS